MILFALDSSSKTAGVCVLSDGEVLFNKTLNQDLTHSETLLPLADEAFKATGLTPAKVDVFAITEGPGSFTGLRIGMSLVKGLALPFNTPIAPVSTLEAIAWGYHAAHPLPNALLVPSLDARRGEVYWAAYATNDGQLQRIAPDAATPAAGILNTLCLQQQTPLFIGDGAAVCYNVYQEIAPPEEMQSLLFPPVAYGAALVGARLWQAGQLSSVHAVQPQYLRLSQAERERAARLNTLNTKENSHD